MCWHGVQLMSCLLFATTGARDRTHNEFESADAVVAAMRAHGGTEGVQLLLRAALRDLANMNGTPSR